MANKIALGNIATTLMVVCAITVTIIALLQYMRTQSVSMDSAEIPTRYIKNWKQLTKHRLVNIGNKNAPLKIIEFSDYECPYCRDTEPNLERLVDIYPGKVAVIRYNDPIESIHHQAFQAAEAARCAELQGHFVKFESLLFKVNLANVNWSNLVAKNGLNSYTFDRCLSEPSTAAYIKSDMLTAKKFVINATPEFIINGRLYTGALTLPELERISFVSRSEKSWFSLL